VSWLPFAASVFTFLTAVIGFAVLFVKVQAVHVLVNSNLTKVMARLGIEQDRSAQLKDTLKDAGVEVPPPPAGG
jgi:hypothetical protein